MDHLSSLLTKALAKRGLATAAHASHVVLRSQQWLEEQLPALRNHLTVRKFQDGTLHIVCAHSIAAQECYPLFPDLQRFLKTECHFGDIKEVRLTRS